MLLQIPPFIFRFAWTFVLVATTIAGIALSGKAHAADTPTDPSVFTDYVSHAIERAMPGAKISVSAPLYLTVDSPSGGKSQAYLQTLYSQCQRVPDRCDNFIATWVDQMSTSFAGKDAPLDRTTLRIVLRPLAYVEQLRQSQKEEPVAAPFLAGLWMICVYDSPKTIGFPKSSQVEALGLAREEALAICKRNTAAALRPIEEAVRPFPPGAIGIVADDPYESSRLLFPDTWKALIGERGHLVAAVPGSDVVLFIRASNAKALDSLEARSREVIQKVNRPMSLNLFRWTPAGFQVVDR